MSDKYAPDALIAYTEALFNAAGMDAEKSAIVAPLLVEADLMGHTTHGLAQAPAYLNGLESGAMLGTGEPITVSDRGAVITWDGQRISGVWLTAKAVELAVQRARLHGTATVVTRRCGHIACLAAYLELATREGCMITLASSDPSVESVAPFGGTTPLFTPNPIAVGIPTNGDPILIDISASITTNGLTGRLHGEGKTLPGEWVQDAEGRPSNDPAVLFTDPPGTILPIGGRDYGHKGFGLALMIEAMTQGLSGLGRADPKEGWGAATYIQVADPTAFSGTEDFNRQSTSLAEACRADTPAVGVDAVRMPGDGALARKRAAMADGLEVYPGLMENLATIGEKLNVEAPASL
ncbi:MAG: Ldh family oxidoreductase [Alphaproteobacteria bacterium]|nr:Ldh family oxidoreductase [Alphaproteobacteria bacterium]